MHDLDAFLLINTMNTENLVNGFQHSSCFMMKNGDVNDAALGKEIMDLDKGKQITVLNSELKVEEDEKAPETKFKHKYPDAIATYKEVVENRNLFKDTLESVHSKMGTKFMIPIIGGKELDLHRLFVEVTSRGGVDKVINDKKWREVTAVFNFPPTATNASFVLRKYYISLLSHYEQIYFFRSHGWNSPPSAPSIPSNNLFTSDRSAETMTRVLSGSRIRKRRADSELIPPGLSVPMNRSVVGTIEGKFDQGYFVSITLDSQKLRGVVFHVQEQPAAANHAAESSGPARRRRRKKIKRDPTHPKPNRSGYNFFFAEQHARLKPLNQGKDRDISRQIGELWSKLTDSERAVYQEKGAKDKERYVSEMAEYRDSLRHAGGTVAISNVMPLQQRPAEMTSDKSEDSDSKLDIEDDDVEEEAEAGDDVSGSNNSIESEEDESEHEISHKTTAAAESTSLVNDTSYEGDGGFEFKKRNEDDMQVETEPEHPNASEDVESKKESKPSIYCPKESELSNNNDQQQ